MILTVNPSSDSDKEVKKENLLKKLWGFINSLDKFTKLMIFSLLFVGISTPFVVNNYQVFNQQAQGPKMENKMPKPQNISGNLAQTKIEQFAKDQILLKFKEGVTERIKQQTLQSHGLTELQEIPQIKIKVLKVTEQARDRIIEALSRNPAVKFAEKNGIAQISEYPKDPYISWEWGLGNINAWQAWDITHGSPAINIAVLDTGIDPAHPDLGSKITKAVNFSSNATSNDGHSHGTHVAGTAAALTNNNVGIAGVGYDSSLMNGKVLDDSGSGTYSAVANGIIWAADNGAKVINMSLGGAGYSSALDTAINYAWGKGVVIIAAAGNDGTNTPFYPAYYNNVLSVAATDSNDVLGSFSNYGDWVDVAAPGLSIYSSILNNSYGYKSGTSMASPHVAGLAGLVFTKATDTNGNGMLNDEVRNCIQNTADKIGSYPIAGGRINAYKAVLCTGVTPPPADASPPSVSITYPGTGATVSGSVNVNVSATDNTGVNKVELYIDNRIFATDTEAPYGFYWDTTSVSNGTHTLYSKAYDPSNNTGTSSTVSVTVSNLIPTSTPIPTPTPTSVFVTQPIEPTSTPVPTSIPTPTPIDTISPVVTISSPLNGSTVSNNVRISSYATDNVAVTSMQIYIDGVLKATSSTGTINTKWNTRKISAGAHTITVKATDPSNNVGSSTITVNK